MENNDNTIFDFFSSGFYEDFWGWEFNENENKEIAKAIINLLGAQKGHILDWCGGWGRISKHFAEKGFKITILDFEQSYLTKAIELFKRNNLPVNTICSDFRTTPKNINADYATCIFNSVGFLNDEEQISAFKSLFNTSNNGAKFILDCMNLLFIARHFLPVQKKIREYNVTFIKRNDFDFSMNMMESRFEIYNSNNDKIKEKIIKQRIYSPYELIGMIETAEFKIESLYGDYLGNKLSLDLPQIVLIASKDNI